MDNMEQLQNLDDQLSNPSLPSGDPDSWSQWRRYVLAELKRLGLIEQKVNELADNQSKLLVKVGVITGGVTLVVTTVVGAVVVALMRMILSGGTP